MARTKTVSFPLDDDVDVNVEVDIDVDIAHTNSTKAAHIKSIRYSFFPSQPTKQSNYRSAQRRPPNQLPLTQVNWRNYKTFFIFPKR